MKQSQGLHKGFTLAEIMIVVTLLLIISFSVFVAVDPLKQFFKGYDTVRKSDLAKLKTAFEEYYTDHECYPDSSILSKCGSDALSPYLEQIPCDPNTKEPYTLNLLPTGSTCPQKFAIYAPLINTKDDQGNKIDFCKNTLAVSSADTSYVELIAGCSNRVYCSDWYGCKSGKCILIAYDKLPTCSVAYNCDNTCGANVSTNETGDQHCAKTNSRGNFRYECR